MLKAIIIDDEKDARDSLKILLHKFITDVEVIGSADGVRTGLETINELQPDVVFLDINMEDGTGFDLMEQVKDFNFHLVFITAYNQYAIKALITY